MTNKGNIYEIKNLINGKVYIGCTIHPLKKRFSEHIWRCLNSDSKTKLCNSLRKYGYENFEIKLLEECDLNLIYEIEKKYINEFDSYKNGMNSTFGGEGCLGYKHSKEIKEKISNIIKDGRSHKGKKYEEIYLNNSLDEKEKRRISVKNHWENLTEDERTQRVGNMAKKARQKSKYDENVIKEIKKKFKEGFSVKELKTEYPDINVWSLYDIKNNRRWKEL